MSNTNKASNAASSKEDPQDILEAIRLLHEFDAGTVRIEKTGDLKYGENWTVIFHVGYGRHEFQAEGHTLCDAVLAATAKIKGNPVNEARAKGAAESVSPAIRALQAMTDKEYDAFVANGYEAVWALRHEGSKPCRKN